MDFVQTLEEEECGCSVIVLDDDDDDDDTAALVDTGL